MRRLGTMALTFVGGLMAALPASAQEYPPVDVAPRIVTPVEVAPRVVQPDALAVTGAELALWVGIAVALVFLGLTLLRVGRRRTASRA